LHDGTLDGDERSRLSGRLGDGSAVWIFQRGWQMLQLADLVSEVLGDQPYNVSGIRPSGPAQQRLTHRVDKVEGDRVPGLLTADSSLGLQESAGEDLGQVIESRVRNEFGLHELSHRHADRYR
jgi:hypothetical protein